MNVLRSRILTALALGLVLIAAILYASALATAAILGGILLVGAWEWSAFLAPTALIWRVAYVLGIALLCALSWVFAADGPHFVLLMSGAVVWWLIALLWLVSAPQRVTGWAAALAGVLALVPTWLALVRIDALWLHGEQWTLFILALVFAADTGAFFAGRHFGRVHLAPHISPNKTWEGVIGGMLLALAMAALGMVWFRLPMWPFVFLCLAAAGFSVVGDLTESMLKRHVGLKDSGRLFPGHGGVLDRMDSVSAATPVMTLGLIWLGVGV